MILAHDKSRQIRKKYFPRHIIHPLQNLVHLLSYFADRFPYKFAGTKDCLKQLKPKSKFKIKRRTRIIYCGAERGILGHTGSAAIN